MQAPLRPNQCSLRPADSLACVPSVCSAHPQVLLASLLLANQLQRPLLVEATSNQVNQFGGYTGMQAADFIAFVYGLCDRHGISPALLHFGGDHLGPQVWRDQATDVAMAHAETLVASYVRAGFTKIHLDCSEPCAGDPVQLGDTLVAQRAAQLAQVCETVAGDASRISYVIGTEVPPPGGARAADGSLQVVATSCASAQATLAAHAQAFAARGLHAAWQRVAGLVVQPGLEFAPEHVHHLDIMATCSLTEALLPYPQLGLEAHSTDFQRPEALRALARCHFTVLKVGPALTHAYRQAMYALDALACWLVPSAARERLPHVMERLMFADPQHWQKHYAGNAHAQQLLRHFSYADRLRYYWAQPAAAAVVSQLMHDLAQCPKPMLPLLEQQFAAVVVDAACVIQDQGFDWPQALVMAQVQARLKPYFLT